MDDTALGQICAGVCVLPSTRLAKHRRHLLRAARSLTLLLKYNYTAKGETAVFKETRCSPLPGLCSEPAPDGAVFWHSLLLLCMMAKTTTTQQAARISQHSCGLSSTLYQLSPIVSFFCVTRTVLAPALADAAAASQPACPPPTTTTSTPVGTSCWLPITPALEPAPAPLVGDIMRSAPFTAVVALPDDSPRGCLGRTAAEGTHLARPSAALAAPRRLLLATTCISLPEGSKWDEGGTRGSTKAAESGQRAASRTAATTTAVTPGTATRRSGTDGDVADKGQDEEDEDEIATGLSRRFLVLLCLMGCPTHNAAPANVRVLLRERSAAHGGARRVLHLFYLPSVCFSESRTPVFFFFSRRTVLFVTCRVAARVGNCSGRVSFM